METTNSGIQVNVKNWFDGTYQNRKFAYLRPEEAYEIFISILNPKTR